MWCFQRDSSTSMPY